MLIDKGADVNAVNQVNYSALLYASLKGNKLNAVKPLLNGN